MLRVAFAICVVASLAPAAGAAPGPGVHYLYLIRHGMYERDERVTDDRVGNGLNALGHEQARLLAARLAALPVKLHAIYASDLRRARETADDLAAPLKLQPVAEPLLRECTPAPAASPAARCEAQLEEVWRKYASATPTADTHDAFVAHGNLIRWLTMRALGGDVHRWAAMDIANASLTVIAITADGASYLVQFSDAAHIPVEKQTWVGPSPGWSRPRRTK